MTVSNRKSNSGAALFSHLGALLAVTVWGISFVSSKVLLENGLHAVEIYIYRFLVAYLIVLAIDHKQLWARSLRDEVLLMICGLCGGSIYFIAENTALRYTLVSNVSLLTTLSPLMTTLLIGLIYRNEKPGKWIYVGSIVALVGVACIIFKEGFELTVMPLGDILAILASLSWAIYSIVLRKVNAYYAPMFITRKTFFYGIITALPFLAAEPEISSPSVLLIPAVYTNILFLGILCSMVAYLIWAQTIKRIGAVKASNYLYFQPIVTMLFSALIFVDDPLTLVGCVGCVLIIGGVWFGDFMTRRKV